MNTSQIAIFSLVVFGCFISNSVLARSPETGAKLKGALANFRPVTPEMLQDPKNADLLAELRSMAKDERSAARIPLIKLGDDDVIQSCLERLHSDRRKMAMAQLIMGENPKVIPLLVADLKREESADLIRKGDDYYIRPVSMTAAVIIKKIILQSSAFTPEVKEWAKPLPDSPSVYEVEFVLGGILTKRHCYGKTTKPLCRSGSNPSRLMDSGFRDAVSGIRPANRTLLRQAGWTV